MRFYIYYNSSWTQVYVEIQPKLVKAFDTTNDTFSCVLKANEIELPYEPMTLFKIVDDNNEETQMWIVNDSVSVFSTNPLTYKHSLTLVQYRYFLNKHLLRNTVFNQPKKKIQKMFLSSSVRYQRVDDSNAYNYGVFYTNGTENIAIWADSILLNNHSKIRVSSIKTELYGIHRKYIDGTEYRTLIKINDISQLNGLNASLKNNVTISIVDTNGNIEVASVNAFDYFNNKTTVESVKTAMSNYLSQYDAVSFGMILKVGGVSSGDNIYNLSFASAVDTSITIITESTPILYGITLQCEIELEIYNYTMDDVISTLLNQDRLSSDNFPAKSDYLFNLPSSGETYNLLTTTYPPDTLSFTQATWYDALTEIFRFYDAGFKFDTTTTTLEIEYYNDYADERTDLVYTGKQLSHNEKDFNNGKVAYYQNAIQSLKLKGLNTRSSDLGVPSKTDYAIILPKPIYDIEKLEILISGEYAIFNNAENIYTNILINLDLTHFLVNREIWSTLPKISIWDSPLTSSLYQQGTLAFDRGSNEINLSSYYKTIFGIENQVLENVVRLAWARFFGLINFDSGNISDFLPIQESAAESIASNWGNQKFNIEYLTETNGRAEVETNTYKYAGKEIVNQNDGLVDLNKLGLNILGESLKNGEPTLTATISISDWDDRPQEGQYITYQGSTWVVNVVNIVAIKDGVYQCSVEFTKNFNALSLRVRTDNEKRLTAVSSGLAVMSEDNYVDYVYVSTVYSDVSGQSIPLACKNIQYLLKQTFLYPSNDTETFTYTDTPSALLDDEYVATTLVPLFKSEIISATATPNTSDIVVNSVVIGGTESDPIIAVYCSIPNFPTGYGDTVTVTIETKGHKIVDVATITTSSGSELYIPMLKYGFGNSICFELQMDHPISAGNRLYSGQSGWFGSNQYFSQAVPYTDDEGWADDITVDFYHTTIIGQKYGIGSYPQTYNSYVYNSKSFPSLELLGGIYNLHYYKKPNEIFGLNYQWCFLPYDKDKIIIGSKFINENGFTMLDKMGNKKFYLYYANDDFKYSILDVKGHGSSTDLSCYTSLLNSVNVVNLHINKPSQAISNWAICDENGDIYLAGNTSYSTSQAINLYFTTRRTRLK